MEQKTRHLNIGTLVGLVVALSSLAGRAEAVPCAPEPTPPPPPGPPPGGNIACEPEPTDFFPGLGTRVTCEIVPNADTDIYRFTGATGDRILAEAVPLGGTNFTPFIEIVAPDGTLVAYTWSPARLEVVLPQSGTYSVVVSAFNSLGTGTYAFTASCLGGSCGPPPGQLPSMTLTLTGCATCAPGATYTVQAHLNNPAAHSVTAEMKIGFRLPNGTPLNILGNKHLEVPVPAGVNTTFNLFSFPWFSGGPAGRWTIEATLSEPDLGLVYSRAVKTFTVTP